MTNILEITDGTTTVNLLSRDFGFCLNSWNPAIAQPKRGGTFQSSSLSEGRKLVNREFENIEDSFNFDIKGSGQPETITYITNLIQLLEQATEYWTGFADKVYIKAKADCEDNPRYALIVNYSWPELKFPYGETFFSKVSTIASMINVDLGLEHKIWSTSIPGESDCAEASATQVWKYNQEWEVNDTQPANDVAALLQAANGSLYAGDLSGVTQVWRSTDNGAIWASNFAAGTAGGWALMQAANDDIYNGDQDEIYKSIDNGASWALNVTFGAAADPVRSISQASNGDIYAAWGSTIQRTQDNGAIWALNFTGGFGPFRRIIHLANDYILACTFDATPPFSEAIYRSKDNGASWQLVFSGIFSFNDMIQTNSGRIFVIGVDDNPSLKFFFSDDNGSTWIIPVPIGLDGFTTGGLVYQAPSDNAIYIASGSAVFDIYKSTDGGSSWNFETTFPGGVTFTAMLEATNLALYLGDDGEIDRRLALLTVTLGRAATCTNEVYIANKQNISNITDIKSDDGGVFTDIFPIAAFPQDLFPAVAAVNDALYIGSNTSVVDTGPFVSVVLDLSTVASSTTTFTLIVEYYNGAWVALTTRDNTSAGNPLTLEGVNSIHWEAPSDWITVAIDGVTAYWIRIRLSALAGTFTSPAQQNRDIYSIILPYANITVAQIAGEIPALLQEKLQNQSDEDGRGSSGPNLWENRVICGLRSVSRGSTFQIHLNCSDEQNPDGVVVTLGGSTTFATDVLAPTGRHAIYNPPGVEAIVEKVIFNLSSTISQHFYGKFHAFVRVQRTAGSITDFDVQLQFVSGSGGITFTTTSKQVQTTTAFELLDLGQVQLPVGGTFKSTDLGDVTEIRIQIGAASGTPNLIMYDLILMPVDEWSIDSVDFANTGDSIIGRNNDLSKLLDVDSITNPLIDIQSLVRLVSNEQITSVYDPVSPGHTILQANAQQRLWFLAAQTDQTGIQTAWIAPPEISHSIQLFKNERYLTMKEVG